MAKVSVIIPTYNRSQFVSLAVRSALNQTFKDLEVIVVDDGSTDDTQAVLKTFEGRIRAIFQPNAGVSSARNTGVRSANSQWIAFLDSDDEWAPHYLARQMEWLEGTKPAVCMQTADCRFLGLGGEEFSYFAINGASSEFKGKNYLLLENAFRFVVTHAPWQVGATIFASDAIRRAGLFDSSLKISEDLDLMARVALQGSFGLIREALVNIYRRKESSECLTGQAEKDPVKTRKCNEGIYRKLGRIDTLNPGQRKVLREVMAANRRAMGNFQLEHGEISEARSNFRKALFMDRSLRSLGRYLLSYRPSAQRDRIRNYATAGEVPSGIANS